MEHKRIKVLQVITKLVVAGAQEHLMYLCDLLNKERYQVKVLSGTESRNESDMNKEFKKRKIQVELLPQLIREINPLQDLLAFTKMIAYMKKERFDIVHTNSSKAGILGRLAARLANVPVIIHTAHGWAHHNQMSKFRRGFYITLEKMAEKFTHKIIAVSDLNIKKALADKIGNRSKYLTIRSGIDLTKFDRSAIDVEQEKRKLNIDPSDKVVGSIIRFSEQKAPADFIRMANEILKKNPQVRFLLVGDGPLSEQIRNLITHYGISEKVILTGIRKDIPELLAVMDVFALTSLWEGLPRVILQAMAMGLPVVATRVDGIPEAVKHGENGFLVPPKDFSAMAQRALQLLEYEDLAKKMGERGRKMVYPEFCVKNMVRKTEDLYEKSINFKLNINKTGSDKWKI